ncbi:hypothetical protein N8T08_005804 [Aspergillus melleus]|uniref:Uncharacterized protein n=1 Tax=Aspergillus melleus TaxID=138277 RepID=A0ACC3B1K2_9EURO|nr:hypothetical protein N8T08_005804 [Aspergillus melleus]
MGYMQYAAKQTKLVPPEPTIVAFFYRKLDVVAFPNPFLLGGGMLRLSASRAGKWDTRYIVEHERQSGLPTHPHVTLMTIHEYEGHEESMLYGELAALISAMRSRSNQPKVEESEALFDEGTQLFPDLPRALPTEQRFPVLMLSFLAPQHARIFYGCMDGGRLFIMQSKLYSFERKADATVKLFARLLLSRHLVEI